MRASRVTQLLICTAIICTIFATALPCVATACVSPTVVYRLYNTVTGVHFYTTDVAEKHAILDAEPGVWKFEGVSCEYDGDFTTNPLYRFYNKRTGTHFYTADPAEKERVKNTLAATYTFAGVAFYVGTGY
jgi:hypothetical protein